MTVRKRAVRGAKASHSFGVGLCDPGALTIPLFVYAKEQCLAAHTLETRRNEDLARLRRAFARTAHSTK
jgi:hypothetical protein